MGRRLIFFCAMLLVWNSCTLGGTLYGFVREKESLEPVVSGNVWLEGTMIGTTTNLKGYYVIPGIPPGRYSIIYRYIGFKDIKKEITILADHDYPIDVLLEIEPILMQAAVVTAERDNRKLDIKPGQISVQTPQLRSIPQIAEPDLFRSLQMLPGVATLSDFSAGLYVRGGSADQNLILLDQIDVYNPNHMFGFFSSFNTDAIKSVELLKGGYPAMYGGRLSSVLNVVNKEGNRDHFTGVARFSLLSSTATIEGPWKKGSWMLSGRRTYLDLASKMVDFDLPYYFYDGHAKINLDLDKRNQLSLSGYLGNDILDLDQEGTAVRLDWGNKTFSSQWTHLFSNRLFSHFVFAGSRFHSNSDVKLDDIQFGIYNEITDLAFKGLLTYTPSLKHSMDLGFETKALDFGLKYKVVDMQYDNTFSGYYSSIYAQDNIHLGPLNILQAGLRLSHYSDGDYWRMTPRLAYKRIINDRSNLTLSYGQYAQFLNLVQQEGLSFADMWFPVDDSFEPGRADHYILGYTYDNNRSFSITVEAYYKDYRNIAEYRTFRDADESLEGQNAAQNFLQGTGKAYGGDVYLRNNLFGFEGWIGYSLGWAEKSIKGYNFGKSYHPTYDRRHTITAIQDYRLSRKWRINFAFKYGSGQPYTEATARYAVQLPNGAVHYRALDGEKNFYRLPAYHRLDIGAFYQTRLLGLNTEFYLQAVNVYNHKNVWFRQYKTWENPATVKDQHMIPFLPTGGVSVTF
ncbi:TonB-dependent receptor [candidate division KSB1 bacterium]|nr:TonB-dependent receptor [candidate division KSB1 bacterium]